MPRLCNAREENAFGVLQSIFLHFAIAKFNLTINDGIIIGRTTAQWGLACTEI
jgi:hypothetical protein